MYEWGGELGRLIRFVIPSRSQPRNARRERPRNLLHGGVPARKEKGTAGSRALR